MAKLGNAAAIAAGMSSIVQNGSPLEAPKPTAVPPGARPKPRAKAARKEGPSARISLTLTSTRRRLLRALADEAADELGRIVSGSEVLLALIEVAGERGRTWVDVLAVLEDTK